MNLEELFQETLNKSLDVLIEEAKKNYGAVNEYFLKALDQDNSEETMLGALSAFVAADGDISMQEFSFMQDVMGKKLDYDALFDDSVLSVNTAKARKLDGVIHQAPKEIRNAFVQLCLAFIACDGEISDDEAKLVMRYMD